MLEWLKLEWLALLAFLAMAVHVGILHSQVMAQVAPTAALREPHGASDEQRLALAGWVLGSEVSSPNGLRVWHRMEAASGDLAVRFEGQIEDATISEMVSLLRETDLAPSWLSLAKSAAITRIGGPLEVWFGPARLGAGAAAHAPARPLPTAAAPLPSSQTGGRFRRPLFLAMAAARPLCLRVRAA